MHGPWLGTKEESGSVGVTLGLAPQWTEHAGAGRMAGAGEVLVPPGAVVPAVVAWLSPGDLFLKIFLLPVGHEFSLG